MADPRLRQQTNSQAQAGAAAQLVINIFFVTTDGMTWTVKPIAFHVDRDAERVYSASTAPQRDGHQVDVDVEAERRSNAQGQGLTVVNDVDFLDVLRQAVEAAAGDRDIQAALNPRGGE